MCILSDRVTHTQINSKEAASEAKCTYAPFNNKVILTLSPQASGVWIAMFISTDKLGKYR